MKFVLATNSCVPADKEGGPAYATFHLAKALRECGDDVAIVTTDRNGVGRLTVPLDQWVDVEGVPVFYARTAPGAWIYSREYRSALDAVLPGADACIMPGIFWNYTGIAAWRACRRHGVPYATIPHGLLSPWALRHRGLKKAIYWRLVARRIVAGSSAYLASADRERLDAESAGLRLKVDVVPNGGDHLDAAGYTDPAAHRENLASIGDGRYVLFLGRVHEKKGLDFLMAAFPTVAARHPDVRLVIAGAVDPAYEATFAALLAASPVRDRVVVLGNVNGARKTALLAHATMFALISHSEGLPVAAVEALTAGLPVILTAECNLPEIVVADAGREVPREPVAVAAAINGLLDDEARRREVAENARRLARDVFSWAAVARRVRTICEGLRTVAVARLGTAAGASSR